LKSGSLNLLEPSGPVQACNGIALPLRLPLHFYYHKFIYVFMQSPPISCQILMKFEFSQQTLEKYSSSQLSSVVTSCLQ